MKNNIKLFTVEINNKETQVYKTYHTLDSRRDNGYARDHNLLKDDYRDIINTAIKHGLTSFRDKGRVVISFSDTTGIKYSLLVSISKVITIISVFYNTETAYRTNFISVKNRVRLENFYTLNRTAPKKNTIYLVPKIKKVKKIRHHKPLRKIAKEKKSFEKVELEDIGVCLGEQHLFEDSVRGVIKKW